VSAMAVTIIRIPSSVWGSSRRARFGPGGRDRGHVGPTSEIGQPEAERMQSDRSEAGIRG
jgi:hypothetical protein